MVSASTQTYMTCFGSPGTGTPQSNVVREIDRSFSPALTKLTTSFRRSRGPMKSGLRLVVGEQPVLIGGEAEEVALLLHPFDRRAERLAADAVLAELRLASRRNRLPGGPSTSRHSGRDRCRRPPAMRRQSLLAGAVVALLGRADEIVVGAVRAPPPCSRKRCELRSASSRGVSPCAERRLLHLQAVLVGAGQEEHVLAVEPLEARDHVASRSRCRRGRYAGRRSDRRSAS